MPCISIKPGDRLAVGDDTVIQFDHVRGSRIYLNVDDSGAVSVKRGNSPERSGEDIQSQLRDITEEIVSNLSTLDASASKELLGAFVSELFLAVTEQARRADRRQKQAEGIAAAKARGVRFGRPAQALPDDFDEIHQAWRGGKMTLRQAADTCGMTKSSFYSAAVRKEQACTV